MIKNIAGFLFEQIKGILAKYNVIRFAPPVVITKEQIYVSIIL